MSPMQKPLTGYIELSDWKAVDLIGPDANDFLNRMSTVNFKTFEKEQVAHGAFLTGKAHTIALGYFLPVKDGYRFWSPNAEAAFNHIEQFHFAEQFVTSLNSTLKLYGVYGPSDSPSMKYISQSFREDLRPDLTFVEAESFVTELPKIPIDTFEFLRIQAGYPLLGKEFFDTEIFLESNFELAVARNKGCYPGQEVVERIFTYGSVNHKLLKIKTDNSTRVGEDIIVDGKKAGVVRAAINGVGLAMIHKNYWNRHEINPA